MALPPVLPECTWKSIGEYIDTASERTKFTDDEKPTKQELDRYGDWLSPEQMALIKTVAANPEFSMDEGDAPSVIARNTPKLGSWDDVAKQAVANKGYKSLEAVRVATKEFYVDGMTFDTVYNKLPDVS